MKELENIGLQEVLESESIAIDGGSEISDAIVRGLGWLTGQVVNLAEQVANGAAYVWNKHTEMVMEQGGHASVMPFK